jgi:hypothetical protein
MSSDDSDRRVLTRKELARAQRRAAYQRAKEQRASDPRILAMKEDAKQQRRAAYQKVKQARATEAATKKGKQKGLSARLRSVEALAAEVKAKHLSLAVFSDAARGGAKADPRAAVGQASKTLADREDGLWVNVTWLKDPKLLN